MTGMGHGLGTAENGERELRRRGVVGAALHHGADTGRWRGHAPTPFPGA
ncbi:hypothetical protein HNR06_000482 [Nocardiopsis arvandica]|uniref:Uncharacterized protein n=1 Tax=Nocardiopsis sinuspersici TaxID=501010 RepID=A0A7Y9XAA0_9ACTN|nr:hypothetical protein [Nocardiopsis sinuspersici]NYH50893.1 hypothetical protein [Nocardiopsis sinuspersici]